MISKKFQIKRNIRVWYTKGLKVSKKYDRILNIGRWYLSHHQKQAPKTVGTQNLRKNNEIGKSFAYFPLPLLNYNKKVFHLIECKEISKTISIYSEYVAVECDMMKLRNSDDIAFWSDLINVNTGSK